MQCTMPTRQSAPGRTGTDACFVDVHGRRSNHFQHFHQRVLLATAYAASWYDTNFEKWSELLWPRIRIVLHTG